VDKAIFITIIMISFEITWIYIIIILTNKECKLSGNTANFDGYGDQSKPRTVFGENTFGNCVTFTIDGQENFRLMYEKMLQAKSSIYSKL
jgi:hypothetical protein